MSQAACAGKVPNRRKNPDAKDPWFPEKGESHNQAKIICFSECPVRTQCDEYRTRTESDYGIWAGLLKSKDDDDD